ncbi:competence type IV pilus minor pilin ComGG [Fictibacillus sp. Mic-4]|uniref:competence type IV pilus minor pilin ComGG n=1 Tax=Fictibacillus TaxID=1329200 RepID=UPI001376501E|nr:competence type IV pilus minor pilin ComGG [Fictibacillus gelatini]
MKKSLLNHNGIIFPTVLVFCLMLVMLTGHQLLLYLGERQFISDQQENLQLETVIEKSAVDLMKSIKDGKAQTSGILNYEEGSATYQISEWAKMKYIIEIRGKTKERKTKSVQIVYNKEKNEITKWAEGVLN